MKSPLLVLLITASSLAVSCKKKNKIPQPDPIENPQDTTGNTIDTLSKVVINLSGMQNTNGKVNVALYNSSSASFEASNETVFRGKTTRARKSCSRECSDSGRLED